MAIEHHTLSSSAPLALAHQHGIIWQTVANAAALAALTIVAEDVTGRKVIRQTDTGEFWVPTATTPTFERLVPPATTSLPGTMSATDKSKLDGISASADVTATALAAAGAAVANHDVSATKTVTFNGVIDDGNSGTADTIDWTTGQIHKSTLTGACAYTFTAPAGPCTLTLLVYQDATGGRTVVWPAAVIWPSGVAPSLSPGASAKDKVVFTYDGTNYWGTWGGGAYA